MSIKFFVKNIVITIFPALCYSQVIDLDSLYVSCPSDSEYQGIIDDFNIVLEDGDEEYAKWSLYDPYLFDPNSTEPSIFPLINKLRVIREQIFSKPLPFADNDLYEYMLSHYRNGGIELSLRTGNNLAGGEWMYLNAGNTFWDVRTSSDPFTPFPNFSVWPYIHGTQLFVHETRHCDVDDPHHDLQQSNKDTRFSAEGGYGRACIYDMWVYKYGVNNSYTIRNSAAGTAALFLMTRFVEMPPTHPNPDIQELIDELLAKLEIASGYDQTGIVGSTLANPLEVTVEVSAANFSYAWGNGVPVHFSISSIPEGSVGHSVSVTSDTTDIMGKASTILTLGDKAGTYVVSTTAPMLGDTIIFSANAVFPPTIITSVLKSGTYRNLYQDTVVVEEGVPPLTWKINEGDLPNGLSLDTGTGEINGIPIASGIFNFSLSVMDDGNPPNSDTASYTIIINNNPPNLFSLDSVSVIEHTELSYTARAADPDGNAVSYQFKNYPSWLTPADSIISGITPDDANDTSFVVIASDGELTDTLLVHVTLITTFVNNLERIIPKSFCLNQNYPNPFNPETTISFEVPNTSEVKINIFNLNSQLVAEIYSGRKKAGYHSVTWDASNNSAGIYLIKLMAGDFIQTRKCILLK